MLMRVCMISATRIHNNIIMQERKSSKFLRSEHTTSYTFTEDNYNIAIE